MFMAHSSSGRVKENPFQPSPLSRSRDDSEDDDNRTQQSGSPVCVPACRSEEYIRAISLEAPVMMGHESSGRYNFSPSVFVVEEPEPEFIPEARPEVVHTQAACDGCRERPLIGVRYKCLYCPDYDLCSKCLESLEAFHPTNSTNSMFGSRKKPIHDPSHRFVRMASAIPVKNLPTYLQNRDDMVHRGIACNTCDKREIVGFRYFCPQCGVSLCEACELIGEFYHLIFLSI